MSRRSDTAPLNEKPDYRCSQPPRYSEQLIGLRNIIMELPTAPCTGFFNQSTAISSGSVSLQLQLTAQFRKNRINTVVDKKALEKVQNDQSQVAFLLPCSLIQTQSLVPFLTHNNVFVLSLHASGACTALTLGLLEVSSCSARSRVRGLRS